MRYVSGFFMSKRISHIGIVLLILVFPFTGNAQSSTDSKQKVVFFGIGPVSYSGDLGSGYQGGSLMFNVGYKFNANKKLNGNLNVSIGSVTGQELDYRYEGGDGSETPNNYFDAHLIGLNYELHYNIIHKNSFKLYVSQGFGLTRFDPRDTNKNSLLDQPSTRPLGETYGNVAVMFPTQIGAAYYLPNGYGAGIQLGLMNTLTDNIDNLSTWGNKSGNDNLFQIRFELHIPISVKI